MPRSRRFLHASERTPWAGIVGGPETAPTAPDRASRSVMAVDDGHAQPDVPAGTECGRAASRKPRAPQSTTGTGCRSESAAEITHRGASGIEISSSTCSTRFLRETVDGMGMAVIADHVFVHFALAETLANATSDTSVWRSSCRSGHIVMRIQA